MDPVIHFEMPYEDKQRMADFYTNAFGWKAQMFGPEMGNYVVVQTTETSADGMIQKPGAINGGLFQKSSDNPHPSIVIAVGDIKTAMKKVEEAGGKISFTENGEPLDIPGIGLYVGFTDTEGNRVSLLQPAQT